MMITKIKLVVLEMFESLEKRTKEFEVEVEDVGSEGSTDFVFSSPSVSRCLTR